MTRVALYARYSSDMQSVSSIEDQLHICRDQATREKWKVVGTCKDAAISGASVTLRSGIQALLQDAQAGTFDLVLAEALEVYAIASHKDQARIVFDQAARMVGKSETLADHLIAFKSSIYCPALNASFQPLSGKSEGKHGFSVSGLIGDEIHEWTDGDLYQFLHDSEDARRQPLEFLISTAGKRGPTARRWGTNARRSSMERSRIPRRWWGLCRRS